MEAGCFKNLKQIKEVFIGGKKIDVLITQGEEVCLEKYLGKDKSYRIDDDVEVIGSYAFSSCENLARVEFSKSVKNIDFWAFKDCATLKEIIVDGSIDQIGGKWMFEGCKSLQKIVLNDSVRHIDANAYIVVNRRAEFIQFSLIIFTDLGMYKVFANQIKIE